MSRRLRPPLVLAWGANLVTGTTIAGDPDLLHVNLPDGFRLDALVLTAYAALDNLGFIAVQAGPIWTEGLGGAINPANLLGWSHFGPGNGTVGTDILDNMGLGAGAIGFTPPLLAGDYTFLIQQTGGAGINYTFDYFTAVPLPASAWMGLAVLGACGVFARVRRRRRVASPLPPH